MLTMIMTEDGIVYRVGKDGITGIHLEGTIGATWYLVCFDNGRDSVRVPTARVTVKNWGGK